MRLSILCAVLILAAAEYSAPVKASSDGGCALNWKLDHRNRTSCNNMAILQPGNDTRTNLMLLMQDQLQSTPAPQKGNALFGWGELGRALYPKPIKVDDDNRFFQSRCQTNKSGTDAFVVALRKTKRLDEVERDALIEARRSVEPDCDAKTDGLDDLAKMPALSSKIGNAFKDYLVAALAFYRGSFDEATIGFSAIVKSKPKSAWLRETALYMIARSELNRAQANALTRWGDFSGVEKVDKGAIANAERGFGIYLKQYANGLHANSARGLMRRVYWLSGDNSQLSDEYVRAMKNPSSVGLSTGQLVQEIDNKLLPSLVRKNDASDPGLVAMVLLYRMREPGYDYFVDGELSALTDADLDTAKSVFANEPLLFEYLQAAHAFYVKRNPAKVVQLIPDDARQQSYSYLAFSRQMLRGMALEATGDKNARGFWEQLINGANSFGQREAVELALALNWERSGQLNRAFADGSALTNQKIRDILLLRSAGSDLLSAQTIGSEVSPYEQKLSLYTLLYKSLTRGKYNLFLNNLSKIPTNSNEDGPYYGYQYEYDYGEVDNLLEAPLGIFSAQLDYDGLECPQIKKVAQLLNSNPKNNRARLCLADFLRIRGFDDYWLDNAVDSDELGGVKSQFPGQALSRLETYKDVIADRGATADDKSYALYRAVWCYGPSGNNSCGGKEVKEAQRAAWFRQLKRNYPNSRWAKQLEYYW